VQACGGELAGALLVAFVASKLLGELLEAHRAEYALLEEPQSEGQECVLAQVDPLLPGVDLELGGVAVAAAVGTGVVVVAFAGLALRQWLVAGGASDHACEEVVALCAPVALAG
jgi:hypothetical protein